MHTEIILSLFIGSLYGLILYYTIKYTSKTVCNISRYFLVIPAIILVMILIISIIKSSIALSLGLVGALSIVRFRTPIKESEELIYLFIAISIGLGLGAGYLEVTSIVFVFMIALMFLLSFFKKRENDASFYIEIHYPSDAVHIKSFDDIFEKKKIKYALTRMDNSSNSTLFVYAIDASNNNIISDLVAEIKQVEKTVCVNVINNNAL